MLDGYDREKRSQYNKMYNRERKAGTFVKKYVFLKGDSISRATIEYKKVGLVFQ